MSNCHTKTLAFWILLEALENVHLNLENERSMVSFSILICVVLFHEYILTTNFTGERVVSLFEPERTQLLPSVV